MITLWAIRSLHDGQYSLDDIYIWRGDIFLSFSSSVYYYVKQYCNIVYIYTHIDTFKNFIRTRQNIRVHYCIIHDIAYILFNENTRIHTDTTSVNVQYPRQPARSPASIKAGGTGVHSFYQYGRHRNRCRRDNKTKKKKKN